MFDVFSAGVRVRQVTLILTVLLRSLWLLLSYTGQKILTWDAPDGTLTRPDAHPADQPPGNTLPGNFKIRAEIVLIHADVEAFLGFKLELRLRLRLI